MPERRAPGRSGDGRAPRLGVDIGGTKIAIGLIADDGAVIARGKRATPRTGHSDVLAAVLSLISGMQATGRVSGIGVGAPGVVDVHTGTVTSASEILPGWAGAEVAGALTASTGLPVRVDNDVRVMALGEARRGAGRGFGRVLFASIGTGVGGALVFDGQIQHGGHGTTGEIAHLLADRPGPIPCGCGRVDHLESVGAGPAITAAYNAGGDDPAPGLSAVVARMRAGEQRAGEVILTAAGVIGRALAGFASAVDVDAVVVGGGVAQIGEEFLAPLQAAFGTSAIGPLRDIPVLPAALGTDAPLIGAAELLVD